MSNCEWCGNLITRYRAVKYCSKSCMKQAIYQRNKKISPSHEEAECRICRTKYLRPIKPGPKKLFCSRDCTIKNRNIQMNLRRWNRGVTPRRFSQVCRVCKAPLSPPREKYCSEECQRLESSIRMATEQRIRESRNRKKTARFAKLAEMSRQYQESRND